MLLALQLNNLLEPSGATATVPDVVGETQAQADSDIVAAGFVTSVTTDYSSTVPEGTVISQSPSGGTDALVGSTVTITVSRGERAQQTPAGISRRRHRMFVEIDGRQFEVANKSDAVEILQRAKALAERQSEERAKVAESNVKRIAQRIGSVPKVKVVAPTITASPDLGVNEIIKDIERLYTRAAELAELRILMQRDMQKQMDDDDEELLLL